MNKEKVTIQELAWDSEFFGYKVGKVDLQNLTQNQDFELDRQDYKLIYIFSNPNNKALEEKIKALGAKFLDRKTEYKLDLRKIKPKILQNDEISFKFLTEENYKLDLINLAYESGRNSRFKLDPNLDNEEFKKLYDIWLLNSLKKEIAFDTIGMFYNNNLIGFITLGLKHNEANIGLLSIDSNYQNRGLGGLLLSFCFDYLKNKNFNFVYVTTQGLSLQATKFYEKNDFKILNQVDIYHL